MLILKEQATRERRQSRRGVLNVAGMSASSDVPENERARATRGGLKAYPYFNSFTHNGMKSIRPARRVISLFPRLFRRSALATPRDVPRVREYAARNFIAAASERYLVEQFRVSASNRINRPPRRGARRRDKSTRRDTRKVKCSCDRAVCAKMYRDGNRKGPRARGNSLNERTTRSAVAIV